MSKLDEQPIQDRFSGVTYSFYTDEEIQALSVKQILNPQAFDHLNNPTKGGLHDKELGVSPFDTKSMCPTCGLSCNQCPGHVGHIELTAPIYNPFLIKDIYKLMKSKCFSCHKLRIHHSKIEAYVKALKLIKVGDIVQSQELKSYFLHAAKEVSLISNNMLSDPKKLSAYKQKIDVVLKATKSKMSKTRDLDEKEMRAFFISLEEKFEQAKDTQHQEIEDRYQATIDNEVEEVRNDVIRHGFTSIMQKQMVEIIKEIWQQVVTTTCPHCKYKSPSVKKDGYTKLFVKPLQGKGALTQVQQKRLNEPSNNNDDAMEGVTEASTHGANSSRKTSHAEQTEEESSDDEEFQEGGPQKYITPIEVQDHIRKLWKQNGQLLDLMYGKFVAEKHSEAFKVVSQGHEQFFLQKLLVQPTRFRPESEGAIGGGAGGGKAYLHTHSAMLLKVIQTNLALADAISGNDSSKKNSKVKIQDDQQKDQPVAPPNATQKWIQLQDAVNTFMDSSMAQKTADKEQGGVRQLLERKEGMFRMKMMGKRVNFGGRSVISPDPYITTDQIGVPVFMARKLTFPESVSKVNCEKLAKLVINGPKVHPGANLIEDEETGNKIMLANLSQAEREGLAKRLTVGRLIVHRHLNNGDVLLVNRQPTLHKPSIMAHIARILPKEQTIRMHYANCSTYNADFDGDEMNIHLPQSYLAASEAYQLMATHKQYVVPTSGKPIRGLIQDSVVSGVFLSSKDCFLEKDHYMQLVYAGLRELIDSDHMQRNKIQILQPALLKPKQLWTGKQVVSTILKNLVPKGFSSKKCGMNLDGKSRLAAKEWGPLGKEEGEVIIRDNELLQGTIDKNQFGSSDQGMVHAFYEIYGSKKAGELLTSLARIFTVYLQTHGFTVGLDDLVLKPEANKKRRLDIEQGHQQGVIAAANFCEMSAFNVKKLNYSNRVVFQSEHKKDKDIQRFTDMAIPENPFDNKQCIQANDPIKAKLETKIGQSDDKEVMEAQFDGVMKAKMSKVTSDILSNCIPNGLVKRFPKNNISAMVLTGAKGGIVNQTQISSLLGQQELEGRRVPKMQNGKTLPCYLAYDPNPRSSGYVSDRFISGLRPQDFFFHCMAGREGLIDTAVKTSRSGYLQRCLIKQLESLVVNYDMTVRDSDGSIVQFLYGDDSIDVMNTKYLDKLKFLENNYQSLMKNSQELLDCSEQSAVEKYNKRTEKRINKLMNSNSNLKRSDAIDMVADPVVSVLNPQKYIGSISEKMTSNLENFLQKDSLRKKIDQQGKRALKHKYAMPDEDKFRQMYFLKYLRSVVHPGENVGTIAAQSIGEPSTQMTLNTFHLAGHGAANMTLGIPRLKEILMTTPVNIKTPCMSLYFNKNAQLSKDQMSNFASSFEKLSLFDVTKDMTVSETISKDAAGNFNRVYKLRLEFEDAKKLKKKLNIRFNQLCKVFSDKFVPQLMNETLKQLRKAAETEATTNAFQNDPVTNELKSIIAKTTKATKVARGTQNKDDQFEIIEEEAMMAANAASSKKEDHDDDDDDANNGDRDEVMDIDGIMKGNKDVRGYDQESDQVMDTDDQQEPLINDDNLQNDKELQEDINKHKKLLREKHSKYFQFIQGDFQFESHKSATVCIAFPLEYKKILMLTLAEQILKKVLVRAINGIEKCSFVCAKGQEPYLFVQGINFDIFQKYPDIIDMTRVQTNHSYALKEKYGIEACRANIVKEIKSVFDVYGISVDARHLSLIGDFVTFNGDYRAFNRIGMEESSSPFLKMSFETTMKYLVSSSINQDTDWLTAPSSALVLGQVPEVGTGVFDLIQQAPTNI